MQDRDFIGSLVTNPPPPEFGRFVQSHLRQVVTEDEPTAYRVQVTSDRMSIDYWRLLQPFCNEAGTLNEIMSVCDLDREFWTAVSAA